MKKILMILCLVTCALCLSGSPELYAYSSRLNAALELMLRNDHYGAIEECGRQESFASEYEKAELYYIQGECLMNLDNFRKARDAYKGALVFSKGYMDDKIYIGIADSFFMQKRYEDAIGIYNQLIEKVSPGLKAKVTYKLGKAYQRQSQWAMSDFYFNQLKRDYPNSLEAELVDIQSVGGNFFTVQVGCFSNKDNADKLSEDLKNKGYEVYVTPFKSNGSVLYRVRVGEFVSAIAAEHAEEQIREKEHLPTHIFP